MSSGGGRSGPHLATLILLTAFSTLSLNMFLPSLGAIAAEFRADYGLVNLAIAGYLGVTAALQLVLGPLSDRYGRRPVMLVCLTLFTLASVGCLLATDIATFLAFRMGQAVVIAGAALSPAIIRDTVPTARAASRIGYVTMAMAAAPMTGPMVGGLLQELFGWRASFVFFTGAGAALLALAWADLGETNARRSASLLAQARSYPDLLRARRFWGYALCMAFSTGAFYAFLAGAPLVAGGVLGMTPAVLGLCLGSITAGFALGGFLSGRLAERVRLTALILAGRAIALGGLGVGAVLISAGLVTPWTFFGATWFVGLGNGLTMPSCSAGAMGARPHLAGSAAGLAGAMTVGGGALVTALTGAWLTSARAPGQLYTVMILCSVAALAAALYARAIERRVAEEPG